MEERPEQAPPTDLEVTQAVDTPPAPEPTTQISQEELDRQLASELSRRGVAPDEVQRLISLGRGETPIQQTKKSGPAIVSPPVLPPSESFKPQPTITLPEFREASTQDRIEADRLLTAANISRRRGLFKQAEKECRDALELIPADAAALELYGDILQGVGRVDDAVYAYGRAVESDPNRKSAEKKYAELTLAQNREIEMLREEILPRNPTLAIFLSSILPGAGQVYNGQIVKGLVVAAAVLACVWLLGWTNLGFPGSHNRLTNSVAGLMIVAALIYGYGVVDANSTARRGTRRGSGWEV